MPNTHTFRFHQEYTKKEEVLFTLTLQTILSEETGTRAITNDSTIKTDR